MTASDSGAPEAHQPAAQPADGKIARTEARRRPRFPPLWVWFVVLLCGGLIGWVRVRDDISDRAITNVLTVAFLFLASLAVGLWFVFFSGYRARTRWLAVAVGLGLAVAFLIGVRLEGVNGELEPTFRWRWHPPRDQLLSRAAAADAEAVDLTTTTPQDVPQFLGPDRHPWLPGPRLARDWSSHPPRLIWKQPIGAGWSTFAAVHGFAVTLEQRGAEELVTCYEIETGQLIWSHSIPVRHETVLGGIGPRSTPTIHQGRVFAMGATGTLRCLDGATGHELWRDDVRKRYGLDATSEPALIAWGRAGSPLIVDDLVVVPAGGAPGRQVSLAAYHQDTGKLAWEGGSDQVSYSSPIVSELAGRRQIVVVNESRVTGHDPKTGDTLWEYPWPGSSAANASASQPVPVGEDRLFLSKGYGQGAAVIQLSPQGDGLAADKVWEDNGVLKTKFTNVVRYEGHVYGLSDGVLECVSVESGKRRWKKGRFGHGQVLGVADLLLVMGEDGTVHLVEANPDAFREVGQFQALDGQTWNNLCLFGDRLLVRNSQEAACYELAVETQDKLGPPQ